jgi:hypothetical protein
VSVGNQKIPVHKFIFHHRPDIHICQYFYQTLLRVAYCILLLWGTMRPISVPSWNIFSNKPQLTQYKL